LVFLLCPFSFWFSPLPLLWLGLHLVQITPESTAFPYVAYSLPQWWGQ
jgi:hypothetical protein